MQEIDENLKEKMEIVPSAQNFRMNFTGINGVKFYKAVKSFYRF